MFKITDFVLNPDNDFPPAVQEEILEHLAYRHDQVFGNGDMANTVYLAAAYLNPSKIY